MGYFSEIADKWGAEVTGIDVGEKLVARTRKRVPKGRFLAASATRLPFRDETFDTVLCTEVIEHIEKQEKAIREIVRVLKKGGILILTGPNRIFKPFFEFLSFVRLRPYHGNENWIYSWSIKNTMVKNGLWTEKEIYFNFIAPSKFLDGFEKIGLLKHLMINYGFRFRKK